MWKHNVEPIPPRASKKVLFLSDNSMFYRVNRRIMLVIRKICFWFASISSDNMVTFPAAQVLAPSFQGYRSSRHHAVGRPLLRASGPAPDSPQAENPTKKGVQQRSVCALPRKKRQCSRDLLDRGHRLRARARFAHDQFALQAYIPHRPGGILDPLE